MEVQPKLTFKNPNFLSVLWIGNCNLSKFKNSNFQSICELGKSFKCSLRPAFENPNFKSKDELREAAPIWVSMLKRNLHKIKLVTFQTQHNEWVIQFPWILSIYQQKPIGKIHFPLRKNEFWTHWEFCTYHQIFDLIFIFLRILFEDSLWGFWGFFFF